MVTIRVGADAVTAVLDTGVDPAVIRTALITPRRVIAQPEDGGWIVLRTLRTSATPGVDEGDDFLIKARRIDIVAGHEVNIASGAVSLALRAIGHFEALAQDITARASGVHKIVGRLVRLNWHRPSPRYAAHLEEHAVADQLDVTITCSALEGDLLVTTALVHEAISAPTRATVHAIALTDIDGDSAVGTEAHLQISIDGAPAAPFPPHRDGLPLRGHPPRQQAALHDRARPRALARSRYAPTCACSRRRTRRRSSRLSSMARAFQRATSRIHFCARPPERTYCVQYNETDFAFFSRLLEHEGIFYFIHDDDASTPRHLRRRAVDVPCRSRGTRTSDCTDDDMHGAGVHASRSKPAALPDKMTIGDYNFNTPGVELSAAYTGPQVVAGDWFEYRWLGTRPRPKVRSSPSIRFGGDLREQGRRAREVRPAHPCAGAWFKLERAGAGSARRESTSSRSVDHRITLHHHEGREGRTVYENRFTCIPYKVQYRPARATPRARVYGVHSAVTTGPGGEDPHRRARQDEGQVLLGPPGGRTTTPSSCWMRVGQFPVGGSASAGPR